MTQCQINNLIIKQGNDTGRIIGIICLNDVFEEMLDQELKDDDVHGTLRNVNRYVGYKYIEQDPFMQKDKVKYRDLGIIREENNEGVEKGLEMPLIDKK